MSSWPSEVSVQLNNAVIPRLRLLKLLCCRVFVSPGGGGGGGGSGQVELQKRGGGALISPRQGERCQGQCVCSCRNKRVGKPKPSVGLAPSRFSCVVEV